MASHHLGLLHSHHLGLKVGARVAPPWVVQWRGDVMFSRSFVGGHLGLGRHQDNLEHYILLRSIQKSHRGCVAHQDCTRRLPSALPQDRSLPKSYPLSVAHQGYTKRPLIHLCKGYPHHPPQERHKWQFYHSTPARQEMKVSKHPLQVIMHNQLWNLSN